MEKIKFYIAKIRNEDMYFRNKKRDEPQIVKYPNLYRSVTGLVASVNNHVLNHGWNDWIIVEYEATPKKVIEVEREIV